MQLEEPLAKDLECGRESHPFGRMTEETRNGQEKAPPGYSLVKFLIPRQRRVRRTILAQRSSRPNREFAFSPRLWHLGPVRLLRQAVAREGAARLRGVLR
jgi:hypothetical protein